MTVTGELALRSGGEQRRTAGVNRALARQGRSGEAAESYQNALRLNPENGTALTGSGVLALRQGQSDVAITELAMP